MSETLEQLVRNLQAHAKEQGWQDVDEPIADLLAWEAQPTPPAEGETAEPPAPCQHGNKHGECSWCDLRDDGVLPEAHDKRKVDDALHDVFTRHGIASRTELPEELIYDLIHWACDECRYATRRRIAEPPAPAPERSEQMMPLKPLPDYGELMPIDEFVEAVNSGMFIDDDGSGYYATAKGMSDVLALPSLVRKGIVPHRTFTHVMWFNK